MQLKAVLITLLATVAYAHVKRDCSPGNYLNLGACEDHCEGGTCDDSATPLCTCP